MINLKVLTFLSLIIYTSCVVKKDSIENTAHIKKNLTSLIPNPKSERCFDIDSLPLSILHFIEKNRNERIEIANPDERFRKSDGIDEENYDLPTRRLILWIKNKKDYVIIYERGGRGHNMRVLHFNVGYKVKLNSSISIGVLPNSSMEYILKYLNDKGSTHLLYEKNTDMDYEYEHYMLY